MPDYNLENIFVRFEQSPIPDLRDWLSNDGSRPVNNDMFGTLNGIKHIREQTKEANTFGDISDLREDLELIEKPAGDFKNLDGLKNTSRVELDRQYSDVLITVKRDIKSADTTDELEVIKPRFEDARVEDKRVLGGARAFRNKQIVFSKPFEEITKEDLESTRQFTDLQIAVTWKVSVEEAQEKKSEVGL